MLSKCENESAKDGSRTIDRIDMIDTIKEERLVFSLYPRNPDYQEQKSWFIYNS